MSIRTQQVIAQMNELGRAGQPFLFIVDFEARRPLLYLLSDLPRNIYFQTPFFRSPRQPALACPKEVVFRKFPVSFARYREAFMQVMYHLQYGDSFLLNLTLPTEVESNLSLAEIYQHSRALYKLLYRDRFVCFSPEIFVRIEDGKISSYPMKGTIDASLPNAEQMLLEDEKERAEHNTIVDLIRNDLSMVARHVTVARYRYIDRIRTHERELLQVSSEIVGELAPDYPAHIGDILFRLLPAGSISGAPKAKTVEIIKAVEGYQRGYYTGVFGVFDGSRMDSAVMIRFLEKQKHRLVYKSGGGITADSDLEREYEELLQKVYVPLV